MNNVHIPKEEKTIIFIDGSYYCFYRYYAMISWWKFAYPGVELGDPFLNAEFVTKFKKTFVDGVASLPKKLRLVNKNAIIVVGKDCKRANIWRHQHATTKYKGTRPSNNDLKEGQPIFYGCPFFSMAFKENLFIKGGAQLIIKHDKLEADDVIAISANRLLRLEDHSVKMFIITSDKDYLQLLEPTGRINIYNLAMKNMGLNKDGSVTNGRKELFIKTVMGDKSDNIPPAIAKCGYKTALKCYEDNAYFESRLLKESAHQLYLNNKRLVDFGEIPVCLVDEFWNENGEQLLGLLCK
jgi:5'-3' exonuclease